MSWEIRLERLVVPFEAGLQLFLRSESFIPKATDGNWTFYQNSVIGRLDGETVEWGWGGIKSEVTIIISGPGRNPSRKR